MADMKDRRRHVKSVSAFTFHDPIGSVHDNAKQYQVRKGNETLQISRDAIVIDPATSSVLNTVRPSFDIRRHVIMCPRVCECTDTKMISAWYELAEEKSCLLFSIFARARDRNQYSSLHQIRKQFKFNACVSRRHLTRDLKWD